MERPLSLWCPSPNFKASTLARGISCVVIHATATAGVQSPRDWLCNPASKVSAHYLIDREGNVLHLVRESNIAWHAGESEWKGRANVNAFSVGLELVNSNDGKQPWPDVQVAVAAKLTACICKEYGVKPEDVVGHLEIAPGRKTDPVGLSMADFRARVAALLS